jgi:succinate dehydrogenase hydrophobic anchor subunit
MFILNKVTLLYDSLMILEGYWQAFISLAAREIECLVTTELCMQPAWRLSMYIFTIRVYYHAWSSLADKPDLRWARGCGLHGIILCEIL